MSVKIRLSRLGRTKRPFYRIVVADSRMPRDGRHCDTVGTYNTLSEPATVTVEKEKVFKWLNKGVEMTETVSAIFKKEGLLTEYKNLG